ncbi:MAG: CDP-glucose 4,6-dehydratase [Methanobacteriota archaeon]
MDKYLKEAYKNKVVLVTGHTGFKGSWLTLWLSQLGAKVVGYSLEPPSKPSLFEVIGLEHKIAHVSGDVRDSINLNTIFREYKPEYVFHLAAQSLVRFSYKEPKLTYETNAMGVVNVLEEVKKSRTVKSCIIVTSDKCYENKNWFYGYRETDRLGGYDPYSSSKACAEHITSAYRSSFFKPEEYSKTHHVALSSARAGNAIGGGDWAEDRIIPDCIKALSQDDIIVIRNPKATRPWQYVLEPLSGYLLLGAFMQKEGAKYGAPWNFGPNTGDILTVEELVKLVVEVWGGGRYEINTVFHPPETGHLRLDPTKAQTLLGCRQVYDMHEAIERTVRWYKAFYDEGDQRKLFDLTIKEINDFVHSWNSK